MNNLAGLPGRRAAKEALPLHEETLKLRKANLGRSIPTRLPA